MRYSLQRETVLDILRATKTHPDADWVYGECKKRIPNISLGTVYRNLKALAEAGVIETLETEAHVVHYDADVSEHAHFICAGCGHITDVFKPDAVRSDLLRAGYRVDSQKRIFYGLCPECARKSACKGRREAD